MLRANSTTPHVPTRSFRCEMDKACSLLSWLDLSTPLFYYWWVNIDSNGMLFMLCSYAFLLTAVAILEPCVSDHRTILSISLVIGVCIIQVVAWWFSLDRNPIARMTCLVSIVILAIAGNLVSFYCWLFLHLMLVIFRYSSDIPKTERVTVYTNIILLTIKAVYAFYRSRLTLSSMSSSSESQSRFVLQRLRRPYSVFYSALFPADQVSDSSTILYQHMEHKRKAGPSIPA